jgi:hypothetical protein
VENDPESQEDATQHEGLLNKIGHAVSGIFGGANDAGDLNRDPAQDASAGYQPGGASATENQDTDQIPGEASRTADTRDLNEADHSGYEPSRAPEPTDPLSSSEAPDYGPGGSTREGGNDLRDTEETDGALL